jgi:hypothetical protein
VVIATVINKKAPPVGEAQYIQMTSWFFRKDSRLSMDRQILMVLMIKKGSLKRSCLNCLPNLGFFIFKLTLQAHGPLPVLQCSNLQSGLQEQPATISPAIFLNAKVANSLHMSR